MKPFDKAKCLQKKKKKNVSSTFPLHNIYAHVVYVAIYMDA